MREVEWLVIHHSGSGRSRPRVRAVARYQTGPAAHFDFSEITYHVYVGPDGQVTVAHDVETLTWSNGRGSPTSKLGVGIFNWRSIAVCFAGDDPTPAQHDAIARVAEGIYAVLGRRLPMRGHGDVCRNAAGRPTTTCPGAAMSAWLKSSQEPPAA